MTTKKLFTITIIISLVSHIALLGLLFFFDLNRKVSCDVLTVTLEKQPKINNTPKKEKESSGIPQCSFYLVDNQIEDTIDLSSKNKKYHQYLQQVKSNIERKWSYPKESYKRKEEGNLVIKFSISEDGILNDLCIITPSGHKSLDLETLQVIRSASPFNALPKRFNLSRLNIIAGFQYRITN